MPTEGANLIINEKSPVYNKSKTKRSIAVLNVVLQRFSTGQMQHYLTHFLIVKKIRFAVCDVPTDGKFAYNST